MEALANTIGLRITNLGACVLDIINGQIELLIMTVSLATIFRTSVYQNTQHRKLFRSIERQHTVVQQVCYRNGLAL